MDHRYDVMEFLEDDDSVLDQLCLANESSTPDPPSSLDLLIEANNASLTDDPLSALDQLCESMMEKESLLDTAPPEMVAKVQREMDMEEGVGGWPNQEYGMAEAERRLGLLLEQ